MNKRIRAHEIVFGLAMICWIVFVLMRACWPEQVNWETADPYGTITAFLALAIYLKVDDRK